jgi:hypothetical protein
MLARKARRRPMLIITTNYDDLIEKAFAEPDDGLGPVPHEVVVTPADDLAYAMEDDEDENGIPIELGSRNRGAVWYWDSEDAKPDFEEKVAADLTFDLTKKSVIYKMHGSVPRGDAWGGGYLIAEEDYARFVGRMGHAGIVPPGIKAIIERKRRVAPRVVAPVYSLLFLGYGIKDWNLRVLLEELHVGSRLPGSEAHYAVMRTVDSMDFELLTKKAVNVFRCDLGNMVANLEHRIQ